MITPDCAIGAPISGLFCRTRRRSRSTIARLSQPRSQRTHGGERTLLRVTSPNADEAQGQRHREQKDRQKLGLHIALRLFFQCAMSSGTGEA
jgi:hypothetical protein